MIDIQQLTKQFRRDGKDGWITAIRDLDLAIAEREFVCVLGPSGCGKSTLINLIAGFEQPTSGQVLFAGRPVERPGPERGVLFQAAALFPWLTARKYVEFALRCRGVPAAARAVAAREYLALVGLEDFADAFPHQLSGGMRQRAELARLLALEPRALLLDEPFGSADAMTRDRLQDELVRIWARDRKTVVFITHSIAEAIYLADRVILMGPPPHSTGGEFVVPLARPRDRLSQEFFAAVRDLDRAVRRLTATDSPS
jgi:ABC-type nitrate/sulfonate/bicarbonate transport system ATPase subunit